MREPTLPLDRGQATSAATSASTSVTPRALCTLLSQPRTRPEISISKHMRQQRPWQMPVVEPTIALLPSCRALVTEAPLATSHQRGRCTRAGRAGGGARGPATGGPSRRMHAARRRVPAPAMGPAPAAHLHVASARDRLPVTEWPLRTAGEARIHTRRLLTATTAASGIQTLSSTP